MLVFAVLLINCSMANEDSLRPRGLPFDRSVHGFPLTDGYWAKRSYGIHQSWDIAIPEGTPLFSLIEGKVKLRANKDAGCWIIIENDLWRVGYYHLSEPLVLTGQEVRRGDMIGYSGNSGLESHGAHLHYFIEFFDGKKWIRKNPNDFVR